MNCPFCAHPGTSVLESRVVDDSMRRRRECEKCENRFTTYEKAVFHFSVIKKDDREEPFAIEKIQNSILKARGKEDDDLAPTLAKKIERKILLKKVNPVKTTEIGKLVLQELKRVDKMAYVRFASIHKAIDDPKMLKKELQLIA